MNFNRNSNSGRQETAQVNRRWRWEDLVSDTPGDGPEPLISMLATYEYHENGSSAS